MKTDSYYSLSYSHTEGIGWRTIGEYKNLKLVRKNIKLLIKDFEDYNKNPSNGDPIKIEKIKFRYNKISVYPIKNPYKKK